MRMLFAAITVVIAIGLIAPSSASPVPSNATPAKASPASATIIVAQRCRCVERRWNGSCKLRVCRNKW